MKCVKLSMKDFIFADAVAQALLGDKNSNFAVQKTQSPEEILKYCEITSSWDNANSRLVLNNYDGGGIMSWENDINIYVEGTNTINGGDIEALTFGKTSISGDSGASLTLNSNGSRAYGFGTVEVKGITLNVNVNNIGDSSSDTKGIHAGTALKGTAKLVINVEGYDGASMSVGGVLG